MAYTGNTHGLDSSSSSSSCSVIVVGAGVSGIMTAKILADNGVQDLVILEASDRIGGRLQKQLFGGITVEAGAGWVQGVGGKQMNPIWELAQKHNLRSCYSDYSNARFNIYDQNGTLIPKPVAAACYESAVESANRALALEALTTKAVGKEDVSILSSRGDSDEPVPLTPLELAIDFVLNDFEMAEVEPIPTYTDLGEQEYLIADNRGYDYILHKVAQDFLKTNDLGDLVDDRLKLEKVVREIRYTSDGVSVKTEDGGIYSAKYAIVSVSLGVLQSELIKFEPNLPKWKMESFYKCDIRIYTKIFLKFPRKFWPTGPGTEFFLYAHERRGYYTFWQHMENAYPGSNILVVTVTNNESKRIEQQHDKETMAEAMAVLRKMFGNDIPEAEEILVPRWWNNRFQRGSYTNYPIFLNTEDFQPIREPVGSVYFTGEHTSEKFNGYVHGAYLSGVDTANMLLETMARQAEGDGRNNYSCHACQNRFDSAGFNQPSSNVRLHTRKWPEAARQFLCRQKLFNQLLNLVQVDALSSTKNACNSTKLPAALNRRSR